MIKSSSSFFLFCNYLFHSKTHFLHIQDKQKLMITNSNINHKINWIKDSFLAGMQLVIPVGNSSIDIITEVGRTLFHSRFFFHNWLDSVSILKLKWSILEIDFLQWNLSRNPLNAFFLWASWNNLVVSCIIHLQLTSLVKNFVFFFLVHIL